MEELKIESMEELREDFKKKLNLLIDLVKEQKESIALHKELISSLNGRYDLLYFQYGIAVRLAIMNEKIQMNILNICLIQIMILLPVKQN